MFTILDHLRIVAPRCGQPPKHVYWCPTGLLMALPLHASGHHNTRFDPQPDTVIDRVDPLDHYDSACSPLRPPTFCTIDSSPESEREKNRVLVVAMPRTPGKGDLPAAATEATLISKLFPGHVEILGLPDAARNPRHSYQRIARSPAGAFFLPWRE